MPATLAKPLLLSTVFAWQHTRLSATITPVIRSCM